MAGKGRGTFKGFAAQPSREQKQGRQKIGKMLLLASISDDLPEEDKAAIHELIAEFYCTLEREGCSPYRHPIHRY